MAVEHTRGEFLDPDEDSDDVELLDEERLDGGRDPARITVNSPGAALLVRARTSGGTIGLQRLQPDTGGRSLQQRICGRQEGNVIGPLFDDHDR